MSRLILWAAGCVLLIAPTAAEEGKKEPSRQNPAAWGDDHVGQPLPAYLTGDECLFCHRDVGPAWGENRHQMTIRPADPKDPALAKLGRLAGGEKFAASTEYLLGSDRRIRFLKRSKEYGKLELLSAAYAPAGDELKDADSPHWDEKRFADRCAGCHATAVNAETRSFSALSLDCYSCHGDVPLEHTKDIRRVKLSSAGREPREVVAVCGQCHLRGGSSKSSGLPYPNTFVAGDNLFRDFQVDLSNGAIEKLHPLDRHLFENVRDVAVLGRSETTCLTCHDVHGQSSRKHQQLGTAAICAACHAPGTDDTELLDALRPPGRLRARSRVCEY